MSCRRRDGEKIRAMHLRCRKNYRTPGRNGRKRSCGARDVRKISAEPRYVFRELPVYIVVAETLSSKSRLYSRKKNIETNSLPPPELCAPELCGPRCSRNYSRARICAMTAKGEKEERERESARAQDVSVTREKGTERLNAV